VARLAVPALAAFLAALLAVDTQASYPQQLGLGVLTWLVLLAALTRIEPLRRAQVLGVVAFATVGEVTGSLLWGVYRYRLHNLPLFIPPAHGLVYLTGLALSVALVRHRRALVVAAAAVAATWGILGLTVLPRRDVAGAIGVPLLLVFLWRSRNRAVYAGVFLVVAALELYGTAIGVWRWAPELPGLGIPDGNPPSGVASGYVWFDVMAMLTAPYLVALARRFGRPRTPEAANDDFRAAAESP
jgi:FtsH-binding integral membrane protein